VDDVLIHYLEVNFADIAQQLAEARGNGAPTSEDRHTAAERLRQVIRQLRQRVPAVPVGAAEAGDWPHTVETVEAAGVELSPDEREVFDRFSELFRRSMERTAGPSGPAPPSPSPAVEEQVGDVAEPAVATLEIDSQPRVAAAAMPDPRDSLRTLLLAAAQQALDLIQVDACQVYTVADGGRFVLRAGVPADSLARPEPPAAFEARLLSRVLGQAEVVAVEDLTATDLSLEESGWLSAGYRGFAGIALSQPLERPVGVLALFRRHPWRMARADALRVEELALEVAEALPPRSLAHKIEEVAAVQERIRLAREIHDGLASDLAAVVALFKHYEQRRERDPADAAGLLPQLRSMTEEVLAGARDVLEWLRPNSVRSDGLVASIRQVVERFGRMHGIETVIEVHGDEGLLTPEQKDMVYQVLRESLSNVRKHARAENVAIALDLAESPWKLRVRDDGLGFDLELVARPAPGTYGLVGMRERAQLLDGRLEIESKPGGGTTIILSGPPNGQ
jgi:signal transduction histidine kinase